MNRRGNAFIGAVFIILGALFLLNNLNFLSFDIFDFGRIISSFWPLLFLLIPGLAFHYGYFSGTRRDPGLLVPGGILLVTGLTCQMSYTFHLWGVMWPGFILAVAVGLFELYVFGPREKGLLVPVGILGGLSLIFFTFSFGSLIDYNLRKFLFPAILILVGIGIMTRHKPSGGSY